MTVFQLICCYFDFGLIGRYGQFYPIVPWDENTEIGIDKERKRERERERDNLLSLIKS